MLFFRAETKGQLYFLSLNVFLSLTCSLLIHPSFCCLLSSNPQQCHLIISLFLNWTVWFKLTVIWSPPTCTTSFLGPSLLVFWLEWSQAPYSNLNLLCSAGFCPSCMYPSTLMVCHSNPSCASLAVHLCDSFLTSHQRYGYSLLYAPTTSYIHLVLLSHGVLEGSSLGWWAIEINNVSLKLLKIKNKNLRENKGSNIF